jgi:hypothetical protein
LTLSYCGKAGVGHFLRYFSLNRATIRLKRAAFFKVVVASTVFFMPLLSAAIAPDPD